MKPEIIPYHRPPGSGPDCSTARSAALRQRRLDMAYAKREEPEEYRAIARQAADILRREEVWSPALARARAMAHVVDRAPVEMDPDSIFAGGEDPFFYNLMLPALREDRYARINPSLFSGHERDCIDSGVFSGVCLEGHITPGCDRILDLGTEGLRGQARARLEAARRGGEGEARIRWLEAVLLSLDNVDRWAGRLRDACAARHAETGDPEYGLRAEILDRVPRLPARTLREALQSHWLVHALITVEMGGCGPGGGIGFGRPDQYLLPFYQQDTREGRLTRAQALEWLELFLLNFTHNDYYIFHQMFTPGTQGSLGGVTPAGADAFNELSELLLEASARVQMPAPYLSIRLNRRMPARARRAVANYVSSGLGFPVVNDGVLIPAMLKHGRSLADANDYICSCCYENTIPGREAFHPSASWINSAMVLELLLNGGRRLLGGKAVYDLPEADFGGFEGLVEGYLDLFGRVMGENINACNRADRAQQDNRALPLMSAFIDDCIARGMDMADGGARYNLTGVIVSGFPNLVNSLVAIQDVVYGGKAASLAELVQALRDDFEGHGALRDRLLAAPKWGNDADRTGALARRLTDAMHRSAQAAVNARGGRFQLALYSFVANHHMGRAMGASADGRRAGEFLTRNMNPAWGTDRRGPTEVLRSLAAIDFTQFPNGSSLDLRFDPALAANQEGRDALGDFLAGMEELGVMQVQLTFADTKTLLEARAHPERHPHLMVKVAGYSARFADLGEEEKDEIIGRTQQGARL